jgi:hypothetical protein
MAIFFPCFREYLFLADHGLQELVLSDRFSAIESCVYRNFLTVQLAFILVAASSFAAADSYAAGSPALAKAGGVFAFLSGLFGILHGRKVGDLSFKTLYQ